MKTPTERTHYRVETVHGGHASIPMDAIDDPSTQTAYHSGQCAALARALSEATGHPIIAILDPDTPRIGAEDKHLVPAILADYLQHCALHLPDGTILDIAGPRSLQQYLNLHPDNHHAPTTTDASATPPDTHEPRCLCNACHPGNSLYLIHASPAELAEAGAQPLAPAHNMEAARHYANALLARHPDLATSEAHRNAGESAPPLRAIVPKGPAREHGAARTEDPRHEPSSGR